MINSSSNGTFISSDSVLYDLRQTGSTGVLIRLTSKELTEDSTVPQISSNDISNNILIYNNEAKLFIPGCELLTYAVYIQLYLHNTTISKMICHIIHIAI